MNFDAIGMSLLLSVITFCNINYNTLFATILDFGARMNINL